MRVVICGCRTYTEDIILDALIYGLNAMVEDEGLVIIEGEARGADTLARESAEAQGIEVEPYPADWDRYGRAAGPIRNRQMLVEGQPEFVVAFLDRPESESKGTRNMIEQSQKAKLPVYVIERRVPVEEPEQLELLET